DHASEENADHSRELRARAALLRSADREASGVAARVKYQMSKSTKRSATKASMRAQSSCASGATAAVETLTFPVSCSNGRSARSLSAALARFATTTRLPASGPFQTTW